MHTFDQRVLESLKVERSGVPIYVQIRDQLLRAIGTGVLTPGVRMPTMRQVAVSLKIDLNTVRHAYEQLERVGAIVLRQGLGSFVAAEPTPADPQARERALDDLAGQAIAQAAAAGLDPISLAERIARLTRS